MLLLLSIGEIELVLRSPHDVLSVRVEILLNITLGNIRNRRRALSSVPGSLIDVWLSRSVGRVNVGNAGVLLGIQRRDKFATVSLIWGRRDLLRLAQDIIERPGRRRIVGLRCGGIRVAK